MKKIFCLLPDITIQELRKLLNTVEETTKFQCLKKYHMLLSEEVELFVDNVALNAINRPQNTTLLLAAQEELNGRIRYAVSRQAPTAYNLQVSAAIGVSEDNSYLVLLGMSDIIEKIIPELKKKKFQILQDGEIPTDELHYIMERILFPVGRIDAEPTALRFHDTARRGMRAARHNLMNRLLSASAQGHEIKNFQLMPYLDMVLEEMNRKEHVAEVKRTGSELARILPEITVELITK